MLTKIDIWIGKNLFHPIIILICQLNNQTQYLLGKQFHFMSFIIIMFFWLNVSYFMTFLSILCLIYISLKIRYASNEKENSYGLVRFIFVCLLINSLAVYVISGVDFTNTLIIINVLLLFGEYCFTLDTTPPKQNKKNVINRKIVTNE